MQNKLFDSQKLSNKRKDQRDLARTERDTALEERDQARTERDSFIDQADVLEKSKVLQEQFIATLSHDLRNPVGAIKMAIEILREDPDPQLTREMIDLIGRNADQAGELILQLLDTHLIKSGAPLPILRENCDIILVLRKCCSSLAPQDQTKIILKTDQLEVWGDWDPRALERAFKNLISNAIKFTAQDKSIQIHISQKTKLTSISFQNFGEVISLKDQTRIFDGHFKVSQNQVRTGWGLGLTLVRGVVEAHGGKMKVESNDADGTIFTMDLPVGN